jgi:hypothetical protein
MEGRVLPKRAKFLSFQSKKSFVKKSSKSDGNEGNNEVFLTS